VVLLVPRSSLNHSSLTPCMCVRVLGCVCVCVCITHRRISFLVHVPISVRICVSCTDSSLLPLNSLVWYVPSLRYTRGLGWRMHCGAEVTESSTNKQHHLSLLALRCYFCACVLPLSPSLASCFSPSPPPLSPVTSHTLARSLAPYLALPDVRALSHFLSISRSQCILTCIPRASRLRH
jgi:hypothetical protein